MVIYLQRLKVNYCLLVNYLYTLKEFQVQAKGFAGCGNFIGISFSQYSFLPIDIYSECKNIAKHNNMETTTTTCRICKNATANNHNHYGSNSVCHSCRAFFMRSVKRYQVQKTLEKLQLESFTTSKNGLSFVTSKGLSENVSDQNKLF